MVHFIVRTEDIVTFGDVMCSAYITKQISSLLNAHEVTWLLRELGETAAERISPQIIVYLVRLRGTVNRYFQSYLEHEIHFDSSLNNQSWNSEGQMKQPKEMLQDNSMCSLHEFLTVFGVRHKTEGHYPREDLMVFSYHF